MNFKRKKWIRSLHTILGIIVLVPLLLFTITGVLLNHKHELRLNDRFVKSEWIMKQYGLDLTAPSVVWELGADEFFAQYSGQYILNSSNVELDKAPLSAIKISSGFCIASEDKIHFFDHRATLIEALETGLSLPKGEIVALGTDANGKLVIRYQDGFHIADSPDLISFSPTTESAVHHWAKQGKLTASQLKQAKKTLIAEGQPLERVLLDLHSGNIFSLAGKILVDLFAIGILGLSISGLLIAKRKWKKA